MVTVILVRVLKAGGGRGTVSVIIRRWCVLTELLSTTPTLTVA